MRKTKYGTIVSLARSLEQSLARTTPGRKPTPAAVLQSSMGKLKCKPEVTTGAKQHPLLAPSAYRVGQSP